jgi:signal transduction histidine kinase
MPTSAEESTFRGRGEGAGPAPLADRLYRSRWLGAVNAALAIGIGVGTLLLGGPGSLTRLLLIALATLPWILELANVPVPRLGFAAMVLAPVAALTHQGHDSFAFMFVVLLNGETATVAGPGIVGLVATASLGTVVWSSVAGHELSWPFWLAGIALGVFAGRLMNVQRRLVAELEEAQHELARQAAAEERRRIAREVHDVIAHSLTVTLLHLTAARMAMETDPREAAEALEEAERAGRQSLADIRRAVGLLREADDATEALPGADDVPALVDGYRQAGIDVLLTVDGDLSRIPLSAGLAVYRIVQESLANAAKHAPGARAEVDIRTNEDGTSVRVWDSGHREPGRPGSERAAGVGVVGMRERASLLGGTLIAGPVEGGWTVECSLPAIPDEASALQEPSRANG